MASFRESGRPADAAPASRAGQWACQARACALVVFGLTVASVLDDPRWTAVPRNLDVLEMESGVEAVCRAARDAGYRADAYDKVRHPVEENLLIPEGFQRALEKTMRLRVGGLLGQAPDCSTWGGMNLINTKRRAANREGDPWYPPVADANLMADITFFLACLALARGVHIYIENPSGSMIFNYRLDVINLFPGLLVSRIVHRCAYDVERSFGERFHKAYKFLTDGNWFLNAMRVCNCPGGHKSLCKAGLKIVRAPGEQLGKPQKTWTGIRRSMRASQAYPDELGRAIVAAWSQAPAMEPPSTPSSTLDFPVQASSAQAKRPKVTARHDVRTSKINPAEDPWAMEDEVALASPGEKLEEDPWADDSKKGKPFEKWDSIPAQATEKVRGQQPKRGKSKASTDPWSSEGNWD